MRTTICLPALHVSPSVASIKLREFPQLSLIRLVPSRRRRGMPGELPAPPGCLPPRQQTFSPLARSCWALSEASCEGDALGCAPGKGAAPWRRGGPPAPMPGGFPRSAAAGSSLGAGMGGSDGSLGAGEGWAGTAAALPARRPAQPAAPSSALSRDLAEPRGAGGAALPSENAAAREAGNAPASVRASQGGLLQAGLWSLGCARTRGESVLQPLPRRVQGSQSGAGVGAAGADGAAGSELFPAAHRPLWGQKGAFKKAAALPRALSRLAHPPPVLGSVCPHASSSRGTRARRRVG